MFGRTCGIQLVSSDIYFISRSKCCLPTVHFVHLKNQSDASEEEFRTGEFVSRKMLLERFHKFHVKTLLNGPKQLYKSCTNVQTKRLRERVADQVRSPISGKCKSVRLSCYRPLGENFFFSGQSTRFPLLTFIQLNSIVLKHFYKKKIQRQRCFIEMFRYDRFRRVEPSGKFHDNWNGLMAPLYVSVYVFIK